VEETRHEVALHVGRGVARPEASAHAGLRQLDALERDRVAARSAHAERIPVVVHHDAGRIGGHHGIGVALRAVVVGIGDRDVEVGGGRRHGAEHLAPVDPPARFGAGGHGAGPREVLARLADRGSQHHAVAGHPLQRRAETTSPALHAGRDGHLAAALHVEHRHQVHAHADRDRGIATRQAAHRHHEVVRRRHAEAAELDRNGRREEAARLERVDRLEREAALAVVLRRAGGQLLGELLGDRHKAAAGVCMGCELDHECLSRS
jgi:hypothetical protein